MVPEASAYNSIILHFTFPGNWPMAKAIRFSSVWRELDVSMSE